MANTKYKPLWTNGGGEGGGNVIFTTSVDKPLIGEEGKLYIFMDENQQYWWDKTTNTYKSVGSPSGGRESQQSGAVTTFPRPGQEGIVYKDNKGQRYIWSSSSGSCWIQIGNLRLASSKEQAPIDAPFILKAPETRVIPEIYIKNKDGIVNTIAPYLYQLSGVNYFDPNQSYMKFQPGSYWINIPLDQHYSGNYDIQKICSGQDTTSFRSLAGSYIPVS